MDKYYVYRPFLNLLGKSEGTDKGDGYNETLGYGAYTGGNVILTEMTLKQIDLLQTKMLDHPDNHWNSSAIGRYQIVRKTLRIIKSKLNILDTAKFDTDMQDRMACFLLGGRGIDLYLEGKMKEDDLMASLAAEWASLPTASGKGFYKGQKARVSVDEVRDVLAEVRSRYALRDKPPVVQPVELPKINPWAAFIFAGLIGAAAFAAYILQ